MPTRTNICNKNSKNAIEDQEVMIRVQGVTTESFLTNICLRQADSVALKYNIVLEIKLRFTSQ